MASRRSIELTPRQREVLDLIAEGRTNYEIAGRLGITLDGAKWHVREVLARLGVDSREDAARVWRDQRSLPSRTRSWLGWPASLAPAALVGVAVAVTVGVGVLAAGLWCPNESDDSEQTVSQTSPSAAAPAGASATTLPAANASVDDLLPRTDVPVVDRLLAALRDGDVAAVRGQVVGGSVGLRDETQVGAPDLPELLEALVPVYELNAATNALADQFNGHFSSWRWEVFGTSRTPTGIAFSLFFLDDRGVVGVAVWQDRTTPDRLSLATPTDWLIAPLYLVTVDPRSAIYVLGRDTSVRFTASLPPNCAGKPIALRFYEDPSPMASGRIQVTKHPAFASEVRTNADASGKTSLAYALSATAGAPARVRPGLLSPCLAGIALQEYFGFALLAAAADAEVSVIEIPGDLLDLPHPSNQAAGQTMSDYLGELTASVDGYACATVRLDELSLRNARGSIEFRLGGPRQPAACQGAGREVVFVMTGLPPDPTLGLAALWEHATTVPQTIQSLRNLAPEPPHREPRAPLIGVD